MPVSISASGTPTERAAANLAGIVLSGPETDAIAGGELFRRHAKDPGREFDREARDRELLELATRLGPEVDSARAWMIGTGAWDGVDLPMAPALL